jgi:serine/threonine-protein kinase
VIGGRYRLQQVLGGGRFAFAYRARDQDTGEDVVVKILKAEHCDDANKLNTFVREEAALKILADQPAVIQAKGRGGLLAEGERKRPYLVLELLDGRSALERVQDRPYDEREGLTLALQLAHVLRTAHARGVTHYDISKPEHFFPLAGAPRVIDWNVAHFGPASQRHPATPQELLNAESEWAEFVASDLLEFGMFLFVLYTGVDVRNYERIQPTESEVEKTEFVVIDNRKIPWPPRYGAAKGRLGVETRRILNRCLHPQAAQRYPSAEVLCAALAQRARALGLDVDAILAPLRPPPTPPKPITTPTEEPAPRSAPTPARAPGATEPPPSPRPASTSAPDAAKQEPEKRLRTLFSMIDSARKIPDWKGVRDLANEILREVEPGNERALALYEEACARLQAEHLAEAERRAEEAERRGKEAEKSRRRAWAVAGLSVIACLVFVWYIVHSRAPGGNPAWEHYFNGYQSFQRGDFRHAAQEYRKAIDMYEEGLSKAYFWLAKCYDQLGEEGKAEEQYRNSRKADDARRNLADLR